jgi:large subunit ribosomal protein L10
VALTLEGKKAVVEEISAVASRAHSAIAAEYRGLSVAQMTRLRSQARIAGVYVRVVRNTLAKRALENTDFACMRDGLTGPLVLAFGQEEPGSAARVIKDFAKDHDKLVVRLVSFGGRLLEPQAIDALASLPTREQALTRLAMVLEAPVTRMVRTFAASYAKLVRTVAAIRDQKQAA